jgi:hypothetical protein
MDMMAPSIVNKVYLQLGDKKLDSALPDDHPPTTTAF